MAEAGEDDVPRVAPREQHARVREQPGDQWQLERVERMLVDEHAAGRVRALLAHPPPIGGAIGLQRVVVGLAEAGETLRIQQPVPGRVDQAFFLGERGDVGMLLQHLLQQGRAGAREADQEDVALRRAAAAMAPRRRHAPSRQRRRQVADQRQGPRPLAIVRRIISPLQCVRFRPGRERPGIVPLRIQRVAPQAPGHRPVDRIEPLILQQLAKRRLRRRGPALGDVRPRQSRHRPRKARLARQHRLGLPPRLGRVAAPQRQRRQPVRRQQIAGIGPRRRLIIRPRRVEAGERHQRRRPVRQRRREVRRLGQRLAISRHRLLEPAQPVQHQPDRIHHPDRLGRRRQRAPEQAQSLLQPPFLLAPPGHQVEHHRMVDAVAQRVLGELAGGGDVARGQSRMHGAQPRPVQFRIAYRAR